MSISGDAEETLLKYKSYGRPYLVSAGMEEGIKYIFTISPLMAEIVSESDFLQCDITYDELHNYPYYIQYSCIQFSLNGVDGCCTCEIE